ncbi:hypothetical protein [Shinella zoogloeoides]|uniref:hypothetical protein n=1 Tax=Shinella zoogloeoides TaxID=352475 RepID=UPI0028B1A2CB|nr:hypothetical protein [Shinella zoogloeoides]
MAQYVNQNTPISLSKPVSLAKYERPVVDQSNLVVVKFPPKAKAQLSAVAEHMLSVFEEGHDALVVALARTDENALRSIQTSMLLMRLTAMNYELECGRRFNPEPIIDFSFDSPIVNRGGWMRAGKQVVRASEHFVNPDSPISLKKTPTSYAKSPRQALAWYFGSLDELHNLLRCTALDAVADIQLAFIDVLHAARDYEILAGNKLTAKAAIAAAFANPAINRGGWVWSEKGGVSQSFVKRSVSAVRNALRAA